MTLIIILAVLCAVTLAFALHPLMLGARRKTGWLVMAGCAALTLALYLTVGSPDTLSSHALFETSGPRHDQRLASQRELVLLEALAGSPDNVPLLLELGTIRIQSGHADEALETLIHADALSPDNDAIHEALGAAHYALALRFAAQPRKDAQTMALKHFEQALAVTPNNAEFRSRLKADYERFQGSGVKTLSPE